MTVPAEIPSTSVTRAKERTALAGLHEALDALAFQADRLAEQGDVVALGAGLGRLREFRRKVSDVERHIEDHTAKLMEKNRVEFTDDGLVLFRHSGGKSTRWQSEELFRHLFGDQIVNAQTGEDITAKLTSVLPLTGSLSWRLGQLRKHGIDPEDWSDYTPGRATVEVYQNEDKS